MAMDGPQDGEGTFTETRKNLCKYCKRLTEYKRVSKTLQTIKTKNLNIELKPITKKLFK